MKIFTVRGLCRPRQRMTAVTVSCRRPSSFEAFRESRERLQTPGLQSLTAPMREEPPNLRKADGVRRFKEHADETNDAFHLAAQVIAGTLLRADELLSNGFAPGETITTFLCSLSASWKHACSWYLVHA